MPGLKDIAFSFKTVPVKGVEIPVPGVSAEGIAYLFFRFPIIREIVGGKEEAGITLEDLRTLGPDAVGAIIACGCGEVGDLEAEKRAKLLPLESQVDLLEAIIGETMPSGPAPFVARLTEMFGRLGVKSMNIQDGISPSESTPS